MQEQHMLSDMFVRIFAHHWLAVSKRLIIYKLGNVATSRQSFSALIAILIKNQSNFKL